MTTQRSLFVFINKQKTDPFGNREFRASSTRFQVNRTEGNCKAEMQNFDGFPAAQLNNLLRHKWSRKSSISGSPHSLVVLPHIFDATLSNVCLDSDAPKPSRPDSSLFITSLCLLSTFSRPSRSFASKFLILLFIIKFESTCQLRIFHGILQRNSHEECFAYQTLLKLFFVSSYGNEPRVRNRILNVMIKEDVVLIFDWIEF